MSKELVVDKLNISPSTLKALESTGDILIEIENSYRNPVNFNNLERYDIILNEQQKAVADGIKKTMDYKKSEKAKMPSMITYHRKHFNSFLIIIPT